MPLDIILYLGTRLVLFVLETTSAQAQMKAHDLVNQVCVISQSCSLINLVAHD